MDLRLVRIIERGDATLGVLLIDEIPRLATLELPWRYNEKSISCIPQGRYRVERIISPKHGETFQVEHVPGRENILFHKGNDSTDSTGCIIIANRFGVTYGTSRVIESADGFEWFLRFLGDVDEATLTIQQIYSTGASAL